jgi:DNA modification methylase
MIFEKSGIPFPSKVRYNQSFEYMFILSKGKPKTINLIRDKKNVMAGESRNTAKYRTKDGYTKACNWTIAEYGIRNNIWRYKTANSSSTDKIAYQHPAIFPEQLAEDHILTWSNEGDTILDPMAGS